MVALRRKTIHGSFLRCSGAKSRLKKMEALKRERDYHRMKAAEATAALKVLFDQEMSMKRKLFRQQAKGGPKKRRGRASRWPGHCLACLMRFLQEPGGPRHIQGVCGATQKIISRRRAWVLKTFSKSKKSPPSSKKRGLIKFIPPLKSAEYLI